MTCFSVTFSLISFAASTDFSLTVSLMSRATPVVMSFTSLALCFNSSFFSLRAASRSFDAPADFAFTN